MIKALFQNIQSELVTRIAKSSKNIIIAVAWFTNKALLGSLLTALDRGVKVSVLINDDFINRNAVALDFQQFIDKGGNLFLHPPGLGLMHNKFCIIDNEWIASGSYNWTYSAECNNSENVIITDDSTVCDEFNTYFSSLCESIDKIETWTRVRLTASCIDSLEGVYDDLLDELACMPTSPDIEHLCTEVKNTHSKNSSRIMGLPMPTLGDQNRYLVANIGLTCLDDKSVPIIRAGSKLPTSGSLNSTTVKDNQTEARGELTLGQSQQASRNKVVGELTIEGLPEQKAGEVHVINTLEISYDGVVRYVRKCTNNGIEVECKLQLPDGFYSSNTPSRIQAKSSYSQKSR